MTDLNISELRKLALAATSGPWNAVGESVRRGRSNICARVTAGDQLNLGPMMERQRANAAFIAAANPQTFLELLRLAEIGRRVEAGEVNF